GGDRAFIAGALKHLVAGDLLDRGFIEEHTSGFDELLSSLDRVSYEDLEALSGASREQMSRFALLLVRSTSSVFVWPMWITDHRDGVGNVTAIVSLALARGFIGRETCGLMPIRGHSGVQGGAEVGAAPNQFAAGIAVDEAGTRRMSELWGFEPPS